MHIDKLKEIENSTIESFKYKDNLVHKYSNNLDVLINAIKAEIIDTQDYTMLNHYALELPIALYNLAESVEELGLLVDCAGLSKDDKYSKLLINAQGTIPEKQARATEFTNVDAIAKEIYERSYYTIKGKIDYATQLLISIRQLLQSLEKEKQFM